MTDWWRYAVIYQIYVRSFADANGDGVGDLRGIASRLGYLRDLGVDAVWLTPFYPSGGADGGYDVRDYYAVDDVYGTLGDFRELIADASAHEIRVLVDLVPNHTSDEHPWFEEALERPAARDRYLFRPGRGDLPPNNWQSVFGGPAWTQVADGDWYLHLYDPKQPDLNWRHAEVRSEFENILRFWFDLGVAGIRIDCAHSLIKHPGLPDLSTEDTPPVLGTAPRANHPQGDQDEVHEIYRSWRKIADDYDEPRIFCAEAWVGSADRLAQYTRPDELHHAFHFDLVNADWDAEQFRSVISSLDEATWVLSNHDVPRHLTRFGSLERARAAALLLLALPGSVYLYQGEELGLPEVEDLPEEVLADPAWERSGHTERGRDGCRVPLPWANNGPSLGFGPAAGWLPQPSDWAGLSVQEQATAPHSTLNLYRAALRLRREAPPCELRWLDSPSGTLAFTTGERMVVVNFLPTPVELPQHGELLLSSRPLTASAHDTPVELPGDCAAWFRRP